jgi:hypothetical protein
MVIASSSFSVFCILSPPRLRFYPNNRGRRFLWKTGTILQEITSRVHNPSSCYHLVLSFHYFCPCFTSVWVAFMTLILHRNTPQTCKQCLWNSSTRENILTGTHNKPLLTSTWFATWPLNLRGGALCQV